MEGLYIKEKRALEEQYMNHKDSYMFLFPEGIKNDDGTIITLEDILQRCVYDGLKKEVEDLNLAHNRVSGRTHHWIGINPPPKQFTMTSLYERMAEAISKYGMFEEGQYMFSVEQNTSGGVRPHIHLFLISNTRPNRIIETLAKHFKIGKPSIDIKTYRKNLLWKEHISYIIGSKKEDKMECVEQDNIDREILQLPKYTGNII